MAASAVMIGFGAADAAAQSGGDFYKGKELRILIGFGPGGGYDLYARLLARHIGAHLPGRPSVVPQNMPGAGSVLVANHLANVAPRDGTVIGTFASGVPTVPLLTPDKAKFDARNLTWIGSANTETQIDYLWHTAPAKTIDDVRKIETVLGATGPGAATVDFPLMVNAILGFKYKLVLGYKGSADIDLAMERGEVHGVSGLTWTGVSSTNADWLRDKKITIIAQYGQTRHPDLPDVPLVIDLAKTQADRQALNLVFARQEMGRPFAAPPSLPAERAAALRRAFDETMKDRDFLADSKKSKLPVLPIGGEKLQQMVAELYATPHAAIERVRKILAAPAAGKKGAGKK
jgi:tripartite-type tricarboxylate transporter receptor subunit TctC